MIRTRAFATALAFTLALVAARTAHAQCTTGSCPPCTMCRVAPASGTNPSVTTMSSLFDQIAAGPTVYGTLGWDFAGRTTIGSGPGWCTSGGHDATVPVHFPCVLLKAIYVTESNWRQFCGSNQTVIAFDCGYGIAQVTSGMRPGDTSAFDPNRVAAEPAYNVSVGASILADKWRASPCIGANNIDVIEDWYFAVWGYNGFAFKNNPNNPMYSATRSEYRTPGVASAQVRSNYPYQEIVWGYAHYPPSSSYWTGLGLAYPNRSEICASCGLPTANISEPMGAHVSTCPSGSTMPDAGTITMDVVSQPDAPMNGDVVRDVASGSDAGGMDVIANGDAARDASGDRGQGGVNRACGCRAAGEGAHGELAFGLVAAAAAVGGARRRRRSASRV